MFPGLIRLPKAVLRLGCRTRASLVVVRRLLTAAACLAGERGLPGGWASAAAVRAPSLGLPGSRAQARELRRTGSRRVGSSRARN